MACLNLKTWVVLFVSVILASHKFSVNFGGVKEIQGPKHYSPILLAKYTVGR